MTQETWRKDDFEISTDPGRLNRDMIVDFLSHTYWADTLPLDRISRSLEHGVSFGVYGLDGDQIGYARVITDYARFAYLGDVFVLPEWRGRGLSKWLVQTILDYPPFEGMTRWLLATRDAHGLYAQYGFENPEDPKRIMIRSN